MAAKRISWVVLVLSSVTFAACGGHGVAVSGRPSNSGSLPSVVAGPATASAPAVRDCSSWSVLPGNDVTSVLTEALRYASEHPARNLVGPSGVAQGRVYLGPGVYGIASVLMPSNVRLEIAPGATLHPTGGPNAASTRDWGLFTFGDAVAPTSNVSIVAGDGCGGAGLADASNKPTTTSFRGNATTGGMANIAVPLPGWDTPSMWVLDVDPGRWAVNVQVSGMLFHWAYDIEIRSVFSIQNPARSLSGVSPIAGRTSPRPRRAGRPAS